MIYCYWTVSQICEWAKKARRISQKKAAFDSKVLDAKRYSKVLDANEAHSKMNGLRGMKNSSFYSENNKSGEIWINFFQ